VQRFGNIGRNILRATASRRSTWDHEDDAHYRAHQLQLRGDFFNMTNTRNFASGSPDQQRRLRQPVGTDGGNRRIFVSAKYMF